ncbi:hypothetical protein NQ317_018402 [Molorchus minor]|uniref:Uncharacterized protein n=1 Tax=Molorchus minor TaxID=1323400 RepID=A0ABQ9J6K4_9CUCU|nr:hypothetical protein NQ317_018402 [Molorchus minor]
MRNVYLNVSSQLYMHCVIKIFSERYNLFNIYCLWQFRLVQKCIKYYKTVFKLNVKCPESLFDYVIFKKQHWFYKILRNCNEYAFNEDITNKVITIKLIEATNMPEINIEQVQTLLTQIQPGKLEDFWKYYVNVINYLVNLSYNDNTEINVNEFFSHASENCSLDVISKYLLLQKITEEENLHNVAEKNSWCLITQDHLSNEGTENNYICKEKNIMLILHLLKSVIGEITLQNMYDKHTREYTRFSNLKKIFV